MNPIDDATASAAISFEPPPRLEKVGRDEMIALHVDAEHCPLVLSQLLACLTRHALIPFLVRVELERRTRHIEIEVGRVGVGDLRHLLQDVRRIRNVRTAEACGRPLSDGLGGQTSDASG